MSDNKELNSILDSRSESHYYGEEKICEGISSVEMVSKERDFGSVSQWSSGDSKSFFASGRTFSSLPPSVYEIKHTDLGIFFERIPVRTEGLINFPQTNSGRVIKEIQTFWEKGERFAEYNLIYKRGILLWGPPGSGKSCTVQLLIEDVISRGGIVVKFTNPSLFLAGMRFFREIQPETPVVVLMEDIDATISHYSESSVLNILDGVDAVHKVVFLATTNYPERLGARIVNRPSRFDKRFKIGHPNEESREIYFNYLIGGEDKAEELGIDIIQWVEDTEGFSLAHLKELFVAVVILGDKYSEAIETLSSMREQVKSDIEEEFSDRPVGFLGRSKR